MTDELTVKACRIINYEVHAKLYLYEGPDAEVVKETSVKALNDYVRNHHLLGNDITLSGLYAALHQPGIQRVELITPTQTIQVANQEAAWCQSIEVILGGVDE